MNIDKMVLLAAVVMATASMEGAPPTMLSARGPLVCSLIASVHMVTATCVSKRGSVSCRLKQGCPKLL